MTLGEVVPFNERDEIDEFIRGRVITSMEAMWRILGYPTYPSCFPTVHSTKIKNDFQMVEMKKKKKLSEFVIYLKRPCEFAAMTITEFYTTFTYGRKRVGNRNQHEVDVSDIVNYPVFIYELAKPRAVVRLQTISWDAGEIWWLRLLSLLSLSLIKSGICSSSLFSLTCDIQQSKQMKIIKLV